MGNIQDIGRKFKGLLTEFLGSDAAFYGALVILVGVASFGFGRLSVAPHVSTQPAGIVMARTEVLEAPLASPEAGKGVYVGSKNGTKYHLPTCPGAKAINEENKVWFQTKEAAAAAGYTPAGNCEM
jgi:hypothetical protein